jgi:hypothetical protein
MGYGLELERKIGLSRKSIRSKVYIYDINSHWIRMKSCDFFGLPLPLARHHHHLE